MDETSTSAPRWCFVAFRVDDAERFQTLCRVFAALKEDKQRWLALMEQDTTWWGLDAEGHAVFHDDDASPDPATAFRTESEWHALCGEDVLAHFRQWPTQEAHDAFIQDWETRPHLIGYHTDPKIEVPWDFTVMLRMFEAGEYELIACRMAHDDIAHFEFDPYAYPYGGTDCMKALITAFGFQVLGEDDGTGYFAFE